ncbi:hypothetical protein MMC30_002578 [Trapelia coarctata]|nr:hypothetical protein [Trapelia coarctata]
MGSFRPRVQFTSPVYSRLPRDDEAYVMKKFAHHASHCASCANPYEVYRSGQTLCPKGHQYALDVAQYVYSKGGKHYSAVDRDGHQLVQIEIPANCDAVRSLLRAMERGLRIMKRAPTVSYDQTYYVPPRPVVIHREPSPRRPKPRLETAEPPAWAIKRPRLETASGYGGRGSLYEAELRDRAKYYKPTVYYRVSAPPVPPKDNYYR